jgi:hypothetical protein
MISTEKNSKVIQLYGKSRKSNIYFRGVESLIQNLNSESIVLSEIDQGSSTHDGSMHEAVVKEVAGKMANDQQGEIASLIPIPILVTLYSVSSSKLVGEYSQAEKIIYIGCMKSMTVTKDGKKVSLNKKKLINSS